ncbi:MAG TPA: hypothetical protein VFO65_05165, partial [Acidimicrobiales bacterium]|nr:hypothetical protein [Acidimicrobiales bacterium]
HGSIVTRKGRLRAERGEYGVEERCASRVLTVVLLHSIGDVGGGEPMARMRADLIRAKEALAAAAALPAGGPFR